MASSVSQLNNYSNFSLFSFDNADLLMKGMLMKQGAIDENRSKLQQLSDQVTNFSVAKDVDRKYLEERLTQTKDIINQYAGGDLSNPNLMNQLVSKFEDVVDDKVLNAVASTSIITREDKEWEAKKGTPEYNEKNRAFALQNRKKYLEDQNVGTEYAGGGGFIKYTDNNATLMSKEAQETLKNLGINAKWVQREDGGGYFDFINTYEGTADVQRLNEAVKAIIGQDGFKQMQIDGWARYGDMQDPNTVEQLRNDYNQTFQNDLERLEEDRKHLMIAVEAEKDENKKKQYQDQLEITNESIEARQKDADFDKVVANPDGTINESAYKNAYTTLHTYNEVGRLTAIQFQKPRLVEEKIDNSKLEVKKYQLQLDQFDETMRHNVTMEDFKRQELSSKNAVQNPNGSLVNPGDVDLGTLSQVSTEQVGSFDLFAQLRQEQEAPIKALSDVVGFTFDRASTLSLIEQLQGKKVGDIEEITLAGKKIKITDENRGVILPVLDQFKKTMVDGGSVIRTARNEYATALNSITDDIVNHYKLSPSDQNNMFVGDNFYFGKGKTGKIEFIEGKMPGVKQSNYKLLMYKASKNGVNSLTKEEQLTLKAYVAKGIIKDDGFSMNEFQRQQAYISFQEDVNKALGAGAVNTMPQFNNFKKAPSNDPIILGKSGWMITEGGTGSKSYQDEYYSGIGIGDTKLKNGVALKDAIQVKIISADKNLRAQAESSSKAISVRPINIVDGSKTMQNLETKFSVTLDKKNAQLLPEIQNGKQTGRWQMFYEQTVVSPNGKKTVEKLPAKDIDGNIAIVTEEEIGMKVGNFHGSAYNSDLGDRSASIELGSSNSKNYEAGDIRNKVLDRNSVEYLTKIAKSPEQVNYINQMVSLYDQGQIDFEVAIPKGSKTYHLVMNIGGKEIVLADEGKDILDEQRDIPAYYQNASQYKEKEFLKHLERQIK